MARIVSPGPSDLTKKRATFGPWARRRRHAAAAAVASNPSQLLEITLFFTGCDPASAQLCLDRPRTPAARQRLVSALNSLGFSAQPRLDRAGDKFARNHDPVETAGHRTSSR